MRSFAQTLRILLTAAVVLLAAPGAHADERLTAGQAQRDLRILERALEELHPGLYRYRTPAEIDTAFARETARFATGGTRAEMFLAAARLAASVRCGHTWAGHFNQAEVVNREVLGLTDKLPVHLELIERRFLVTASAVDSIAAEDELLAIEGRPVPCGRTSMPDKGAGCR